MARINTSLDELKGKSRETARNVGELGRELRTLGREGAAAVGRGLSVGVTLPIIALATASVKAAADMQSLRLSLIAISSSASEADTQLSRLKEIGKLPGIGFEEAVRGSIRLQAVGVSAKQAERELIAFSNAISLAGGGREDLEAVVINLQQIRSAGKLTGDELRETAQRIPQIRAMIKEAFGTASTEELSKMGVTAEEVISVIVQGSERLPKAAHTIKTSFDNLGQDVKVSLGKVGESLLPVVSRVVDFLAPAVVKMADSFASASPGMQNFILISAGIAAALGPVTLAIIGVVTAIEKLRIAWGIIVSMKAAIVAVFGTKAVATTADTAATNLNTAAEGRNVVATGAVSKAKDVSAAAVGKSTLSFGYNTVSVNTNTAALARNVVVSKGTGAVGAVPVGAVPAGGGGLSGGAVGAAAIAGTILGYYGPEIRDYREGLEPIPQEAVFGELGINPSYRPDAETQKAIQANEAEFQTAKRAGDSPRQRILRGEITGTGVPIAAQSQEKFAGSDFRKRAQAARDKATAEETAKAEDEYYSFRKEQIKSGIEGVDKGLQSQAEVNRLIPALRERQAILTNRAKAIKGEAEKDPKIAQEYWGIVRENMGIEGEVNKLQLTLQKDRAEAIKKRTEEQKKLRESSFAILEMQAKHEIGLIEDQFEKPIAEFNALVPILTGKQEAVLSELESVKAGTIEHGRLVQEYWSIQSDINSLETEAAKAVRDRQKQELENRRKLTAAIRDTRIAQVQAELAHTSEDQNAQVTLKGVVPVLRQNAADLLEANRSISMDRVEYWNNLKEVYSIEAQIGQMERAAVREREQNQKKALDESKRLRQEQTQITEGRFRLAEAQLRNNPFLSENQRTRMLLPLMVEQYRSLQRAVFGESEIEAIQRQIQAEGVKGNIIQSAIGSGVSARTIGGGVLPMFDQRRLGAILGHLGTSEGYSGDAERLAREAGKGAPVVYQLVLPNVANEEQFNRIMPEMLRRLWRQAQGLGPGN